MKRILDFIISSVLLTLLSPIFLIIALIIKFTSKGEVFFKQKRAGRDKKPFMMFKFRTMIEGAEKIKTKIIELNEADGPVFKIDKDPRLTDFGKVLRKTGLDELPQLFNIIKGEMSIVGPRPLPIDEAEKVPEKYNGRFSVVPGITSLWVIRGSHRLTFKQWMRSDLEYVRNRNTIYDLRIMIKTAILILKYIFVQVVGGFVHN